MGRILLIDDESCIRDFISDLLGESHTIETAASGEAGFELAKSSPPDLILLDILMPGENGVEIGRKLRAHPVTRGIPIIMLTALNEPEQRINAYAAGADDYLAKPFHPTELVARIESKLKRLAEARCGSESSSKIRVGALEIDLNELRVIVAGKDLQINGLELKLLVFLARHSGQIISRKMLEGIMWGSDKPSDRALDPHIASLRKKLLKGNVEIRTSYGNGFMLAHRGQSALVQHEY